MFPFPSPISCFPCNLGLLPLRFGQKQDILNICECHNFVLYKGNFQTHVNYGDFVIERKESGKIARIFQI